MIEPWRYQLKVLISLACASLVLIFGFSALALIDDFGDGRDDGWTVIQGDWLVKDGKYFFGRQLPLPRAPVIQRQITITVGAAQVAPKGKLE